MRTSTVLVLGLLCWEAAAPAQTSNLVPPADTPDSATAKTGVLGATGAITTPDYAPLTASERWRLYFISAFGPGAILRSAAAAGITQWDGTPKEWGYGADAYGERFGNYFAQYIMLKTLESGAAAALHQDDRYFRSTDTGFWKRTKHAVTSVFVARNEAGKEQFAYAHVGATLGTAFISRIWQPRSEDSAGDAAVSFGANMAADMGWNVFKEFCPKRFRRN